MRKRREFHQSSQRMEPSRLVVYQSAEFFECFVVVGSTSLLKFMNRLRVELVKFSVAPPLVLTILVQRLVMVISVREALLVPKSRFFGDYFKADAADSRGRPRK